MSDSPIRDYGKVYSLGHAAIGDLLHGPIIVEEKIDGSQFSFLKDDDGELHFRSKGCAVDPNAPGMFSLAVEQVTKRRDAIRPGLIHRGEYLAKRKHNTLHYGRVPTDYLILFDIHDEHMAFKSIADRKRIADELGFECVPVIDDRRDGSGLGMDWLNDTLANTVSTLGDCPIEGVVIKAIGRFGVDGKSLKGKYVSEAFKETHKKDWKERNPAGKDIQQQLADSFRSTVRWEKVLQHMREDGMLLGEPRDIGEAMKRIPNDLRAECEDEIKDALFKWAWPNLSRVAGAGFPEWYKQRLAERQFATADTN